MAASFRRGKAILSYIWAGCQTGMVCKYAKSGEHRRLAQMAIGLDHILQLPLLGAVAAIMVGMIAAQQFGCLLYTSPSPRD